MTDGTALRAEPGGRGRDARSRFLRTVDVALSQDAATYVVVTALLAGVALRIAVYTSSLMGFDADEAVWGLMARRVLHGEVSTFFWGQNHGGTQEVLLTSLVFAPFGSSVLALRVVPIVLSAVTAYLVWRVGRRTIGEPAARIAAALFWVWPVYSVWKLGHAHGFYASGVLYCALILLLALRLAEENSPRRAAVFGLVLGLAVWQTLQILPIVAGTLVWLTWKHPRVWLNAWAAIPAFLLGNLPFLLSNIRHDWWSFTLENSAETPLPLRLRYFFAATLPGELGLRVPFEGNWLFGRALSGAVYLAALALFVVAAVMARKAPRALLFCVAAVFPFLSVLSGATFLTTEPRYVEILAPVLALLVAIPLVTPRRGAIALAVAVAISTVGFVEAERAQERAVAHSRGILPRHFGPLIRALDAKGLNHVFADYWLAYRLDFATEERIVAADADMRFLSLQHGRVLPPPVKVTGSRHPVYFEKVLRAPRYGFVVVSEAESPAGRRLLERHGFHRTRVGAFAIYDTRG